MTGGFVPFPGSGAYGHWSCELRHWHVGRHRFRNYTIGRAPHVWRVRDLITVWKGIRLLRGKRLPHRQSWYRSVLYPTKYDPVPS